MKASSLVSASAALIVWGSLVTPSIAATVPLHFSSLVASATVGTQFSADQSLIVDTLVTTETGALNQTITFTANGTVTAISGRAAWETSTATSILPRLVGVNIDIFNSSDTLIYSDTFSGSLGGYAVSTFPLGNLQPGTYRAVITGNGVRDSQLDMALTFTGVPSLANKTVTSNTLVNSNTIATPFGVGSTLTANTLITDETGALSQTINFTVGSGVDTITGEAQWETSLATGFGPRLTGVNIDIFDSSNNLVLSDTFTGILDGFAFSSLNSSLTPGTYRLVATGTGVRESSLNISLGFTGVVPEPATGVLALGAIALLRGARRRRVP